MPGSVVARVVDPAFVRATFYLSNADLRRGERQGVGRGRGGRLPSRTFEGAVRRVGLEAEFTPRNIQTRVTATASSTRSGCASQASKASCDRACRSTVTLPEGGAS
ncbi:MAG: hypothetical protein R3B82_03655 [Sandaracinaceae bacterium]